MEEPCLSQLGLAYLEGGPLGSWPRTGTPSACSSAQLPCFPSRLSVYVDTDSPRNVMWGRGRVLSTGEKQEGLAFGEIMLLPRGS